VIASARSVRACLTLPVAWTWWIRAGGSVPVAACAIWRLPCRPASWAAGTRGASRTNSTRPLAAKPSRLPESGTDREVIPGRSRRTSPEDAVRLPSFPAGPALVAGCPGSTGGIT